MWTSTLLYAPNIYNAQIYMLVLVLLFFPHISAVYNVLCGIHIICVIISNYIYIRIVIVLVIIIIYYVFCLSVVCVIVVSFVYDNNDDVILIFF